MRRPFLNLNLSLLALLALLAVGPLHARAPGAQVSGPEVWSELTGEVKTIPGGVETLAAGPSHVLAGHDGKVYVAAPLDGCLLVLDRQGRRVRRLDFAGSPRGLDAWSDGRLAVLDGRRQAVMLYEPGSAGFQRIGPQVPLTGAHGLAFDPHGTIRVLHQRNRSHALDDRGLAPDAPERALPLARSGRQAVLLKTSARGGEVRAAAWEAPSRVLERGEGAPEDALVTWHISSEHELGALHLAGEDDAGRLYVVAEELASRTPVRVLRRVWVLEAGGGVAARFELPPPSEVHVVREWAVRPDGLFLLLRVGVHESRVLAWRVGGL
jgi:hypothetical protein